MISKSIPVFESETCFFCNPKTLRHPFLSFVVPADAQRPRSASSLQWIRWQMDDWLRRWKPVPETCWVHAGPSQVICVNFLGLSRGLC